MEWNGRELDKALVKVLKVSAYENERRKRITVNLVFMFLQRLAKDKAKAVRRRRSANTKEDKQRTKVTDYGDSLAFSGTVR